MAPISLTRPFSSMSASAPLTAGIGSPDCSWIASMCVGSRDTSASSAASVSSAGSAPGQGKLTRRDGEVELL